MKKYINEILILLGKDTKQLPKLLLLFMVVSALDVVGIGLIGPYISMVVDPQMADSIFKNFSQWIKIPSADDQRLRLMSYLLLCVFFIKTLSSIWVNYIILKFSAKQQARLRLELMHSYQSLPYTEFLQRNSSEYIYSIQTLTGQFSGGVVHIGLRAISDGIVAIAILILLAFTNINAFLLLVGILVASVFIYDKVFRNKIRSYGKRANEASTLILRGVNEAIDGLKEIRILGRENYFYKQVKDNTNIFAIINTNYSVITTFARYLFELIMVLFVVILVLMTINQHQDSTSILPTLGIFGIAAVRLLPAINVFTISIATLRYNRDAVSRLYNDVIKLQLKPRVETKVVQNEHSVFKELIIENISFNYPTVKESAVADVSLRILKGESIGIIGPSGSGKTTLLNLLLGLLKPNYGEIWLNEKPLNYSLDEWYSMVAYLPQEVFLLDDSLRRNVALGVDDKDINEGNLNQALRKARLSDLVDKLSAGSETILGDKGVRLSGGQRQRVALARAFYHKRDVLVMDESTSALDNKMEQEIVKEIEQLKGNKTLIVVAHRLSTVQNCDRIYRLENGQIVDSGKPEEIL